MHIGGDRRRGELTDAFIKAVSGLADRLIVVKSGNFDGIFTTAKSPGAKLTEVETAQAIVPVLLDATLKEWGGMCGGEFVKVMNDRLIQFHAVSSQLLRMA